MFEKYGVLDFFCGLRKYLKILVIICVLGLLCGIGLDMLKQVQMAHDEMAEADDISYTNSDSFSFTYVDIADTGENGRAYLQQVASSCRIYLESDFARQYVYDYLAQAYGTKHMIRLFQEVDAEFEEEDYDLEYLKSFLTCKVLDDGVTVNFWITSTNEELTDTLLEAYRTYVSYLETNVYGDLKFVDLGGTKQMYNQEEMEAKEEAEETGGERHSSLRKGILPLAAGVLCVVVIFFYTLFFPTMNRKSDFTSYQVSVLGELSKKDGKKEQTKNAQQCLRIMNALENKRIVAVTASMDQAAVSRTVERMQQIAAKDYCVLQYDAKELDYQGWMDTHLTDAEQNYLIQLPSLSVYETALQVSKAADAVLLVEAYGDTRYSGFERMIELANEYQLKLSGVVVLY